MGESVKAHLCSADVNVGYNSVATPELQHILVVAFMSLRTSGDPATGGSGGVPRLQVQAVSEVLEPMLEILPAVLAARECVETYPDDAPDIGDLDRLLSYTTRWHLLELLLASIPRSSWPDGVAVVERAARAVNQTLRRPLTLEL